MPADPNFRPSPRRAIYVRGTIDQNLVDLLTPEIFSLQHASRAPITVYIDSRGGSTVSAHLLSRLLKATDQDGSAPCRIITVATGRAASAAADLLCDGNYALVYPETIIHFHGVRYLPDDPLTLEAASFMAQSLKLGNDQYAFALARKCISRFIVRYLSLRSECKELSEQKRQEAQELSDLDCLCVALNKRVSSQSSRVLKQTLNRYGRYNQLLLHVSGALAGKAPHDRLAQAEAAILRAILDYELTMNDAASWTFEHQGLRQLQDDFLLLVNYLKPRLIESLEYICDAWGNFFLTESDLAELASLPEEQRSDQRLEKLKPILQPFWFFFVALCHVLQEGENELTAHDCYWLGLIDEIIGDNHLSNLRQVVEFAPPAEGTS